jgi:hypothetical protein
MVMPDFRTGLTAVELQDRARHRAEYASRLYQDGWTLSRVGKLFGVTRERVRQILCWHIRAEAREFRGSQASQWREHGRWGLRRQILLMTQLRQEYLEAPVPTDDLKILAGAPLLRELLTRAADPWCWPGLQSRT